MIPTFTQFSSGAGDAIQISTAMTEIGTIVSNCINWIESNLVLMTCFVAGLVPVGFMVIRKAKKASKA